MVTCSSYHNIVKKEMNNSLKSIVQGILFRCQDSKLGTLTFLYKPRVIQFRISFSTFYSQDSSVQMFSL